MCRFTCQKKHFTKAGLDLNNKFVANAFTSIFKLFLHKALKIAMGL